MGCVLREATREDGRRFQNFETLEVMQGGRVIGTIQRIDQLAVRQPCDEWLWWDRDMGGPHGRGTQAEVIAKIEERAAK